ncbi:BRO family protein [uncultured Halomonas sp.]|uniref:BRO family protein n=1 Tax=uncultured Halomonas sp. TaxID=173971 RepID=UPI002633857F|nr:BRO family protein [uncultured Halomonas sp.]
MSLLNRIQHSQLARLALSLLCLSGFLQCVHVHGYGLLIRCASAVYELGFPAQTGRHQDLRQCRATAETGGWGLPAHHGDTPSTNTHHASFEGIRREDEQGNEYWSARELAPLLEYHKWQNFSQVISKARLACEQSGNEVSDHFADVSKMVEIGSGAQRPVADVHLSRYACYLIVQNGDPAKPVNSSAWRLYSSVTREVWV